jgi:hypothetical protein
MRVLSYKICSKFHSTKTYDNKTARSEKSAKLGFTAMNLKQQLKWAGYIFSELYTDELLSLQFQLHTCTMFIHVEQIN